LTQDHKARLANTLFGIAELSEADMELVSLVEELGDDRLAPYLVTQLRLIADDSPRFAVPLIETIARVIDDKDLKRLADESSDAAIAAIFNRSEYLYEPERSAMLKDFLKLVSCPRSGR